MLTKQQTNEKYAKGITFVVVRLKNKKKNIIF